MGVDFVALMAHHLTPDELELLPKNIDASYFPALTTVIMDSIAHHTNAVNWPKSCLWNLNQPATTLRDELVRESFVELSSPGGFRYAFNRSLCKIYHVTRWQIFLCDPTTQNMLRQMCFELSQFFRCNRAIYIPDSNWRPSGAVDFVYDSASIDDVEAWLFAECGQPAHALGDIYVKKQTILDGKLYDKWEGNGYFIDTFAGLRV
jgi:hypothetical protein